MHEEELGYRYVARTGIFRVAAAGDRLVALACAIVRDDEWFLSGFWTLPTEQGRGLGGPLLRQVWEEGVRLGARRQFVWASIDPPAIASYMKLGMLPGSQLFAFKGVPRISATDGLDTAPLTADAAAAIDRTVRGVPRVTDHQWWQGQAGYRARLVKRSGKVAGYYYIHDGAIGPAAWLADADGAPLLALAMKDAAADADEVQLVAPGMDHTAIAVALGAGLRLVRTSHLLWTEPFGQMEHYVPSGPLLF